MAPLVASITDYRQRVPDIDIAWDTRSLEDFGDGKLEDLLGYDLIIFDHPYCGQIAEENCLVDFTDRLSLEEQAHFARDSLGLCWASYHANGGIWGLPIDAAAQVASYRPDLMDELQSGEPRTIDEVIALGRRAREHDMYIALPAQPIDAMCTLLTLCANAGMPVSRDGTFFPEIPDMVAVLETMKALVDVAHPESLNWDPIGAYDYMSTADDVLYIPFAFGYTNYSRRNQRKPIRFCNIPGMSSDSCNGALLGGAGIGVSAGSRQADAAVDYARFLCSSDYQQGPYFRNGGQPASLAAWTNGSNDSECLDFFSGTIDTMRQAYLRPTYNGYISHFRRAGPRIHACLEGQATMQSVARWLRDDYLSRNPTTNCSGSDNEVTT